MSDNDISQIKDRLTRLEVQVVEKWASHDQRSDERWADLMEKFHEMAKKLDGRACVAHAELLNTTHHRLIAIEKWQNAINWALGIVYIAMTGAIITVIFKHIHI